MNDYETKRAEKIAYYRDMAERRKRQSEAMYNMAKRMSDVIPFGQPILVGHHSEGRDRSYRGKINALHAKAGTLFEQADYYAGKAHTLETNTSISSDNPDAVSEIEAKVAKLEALQEKMKAFNKALKKNDEAAMLALGFTEAQIARLKTPDFAGRVGFPAYEITNNGANIRRYKKRIAELAVRSTQVTTEAEVAGVKVVDSVEDNRIQLFFTGKPSEAIRTSLKREGFHWTPSIGAWQRYRSPYALARAKEIISSVAA